MKRSKRFGSVPAAPRAKPRGLTQEDVKLLNDAEHTRQLLLERMARDEEERIKKLRRKAGYRD
jgi:hypothetical protein